MVGPSSRRGRRPACRNPSLLRGQLTDVFVADFPELRLRAFKRMRNLVAHRYQHVDYEIIWQAIVVDVPRLDRQVTEILQRL